MPRHDPPEPTGDPRTVTVQVLVWQFMGVIEDARPGFCPVCLAKTPIDVHICPTVGHLIKWDNKE